MLVVIDLQDHYIKEFLKQETHWDHLLVRLQERIVEAAKSKELIINLTCWEDGCTVPEVLSILKAYKRLVYLQKEDFDGSKELKLFIETKNLQDEPIELCGAFKDVCVLETWKGLKRSGYKIQPVDPSLVIETNNNWRQIGSFPKNYEKVRETKKTSVSKKRKKGRAV